MIWFEIRVAMLKNYLYHNIFKITNFSLSSYKLLLQEMSWSKQPLIIPIERYITHLLEEVPFPEPTILLQVCVIIYTKLLYTILPLQLQKIITIFIII